MPTDQPQRSLVTEEDERITVTGAKEEIWSAGDTDFFQTIGCRAGDIKCVCPMRRKGDVKTRCCGLY